jgi:hypothetical protein
MRQRDPTKAVQVLDLLLAFFGTNGAQWLRGGFLLDGSLCLVNALAHVRRAHRITGDGTGYYLQDAMPQPTTLLAFNDDCKDFGEMRALIRQARARAVHDCRKRHRLTAAHKIEPTARVYRLACGGARRTSDTGLSSRRPS